jgi:hypothetical protein
VSTCGVSGRPLRYLYAINEQEDVIFFIPVNLANRCFVTHGSELDSPGSPKCSVRWSGYKAGGTARNEGAGGSAEQRPDERCHKRSTLHAKLDAAIRPSCCAGLVIRPDGGESHTSSGRSRHGRQVRQMVRQFSIVLAKDVSARQEKFSPPLSKFALPA